MKNMAYSLLILASTTSCTDKHEKAFTKIYDKAVWGKNTEGVAHSGGGSTYENTTEYRLLLQNFIKDKNIQSVVDAGCGDWEFSKTLDWSGINYTGYDVVKNVIDQNKKRYSSDKIHFITSNFLKAKLPKADLLICKHVLQHLSNEDIQNFLPQLKKYKYCIITNEVYPDSQTSDNPDTSIGGGHKVDLSKAPFNIKGKKVLNYMIEGAMHQVFLIENE